MIQTFSWIQNFSDYYIYRNENLIFKYDCLQLIEYFNIIYVWMKAISVEKNIMSANLTWNMEIFIDAQRHNPFGKALICTQRRCMFTTVGCVRDKGFEKYRPLGLCYILIFSFGGQTSFKHSMLLLLVSSTLPPPKTAMMVMLCVDERQRACVCVFAFISW